MRRNTSRFMSVMFAPVRVANAWSEALGEAVAKRVSWSPVEEHVVITIDDSDDNVLVNTSIHGVIRCGARASDGSAGDDLLIELKSAVAYHGRFDSDSISWLVATPCIRRQPPQSLLFSWAAVRLIDALSFPAATRNRTVGFGRLRLYRPNDVCQRHDAARNKV